VLIMKARNASPIIPNMMKMTMFPTMHKQICTLHCLSLDDLPVAEII
jgi:hypothetical protein